ncbi:hypothetical protein Cni_G10760 [Canna indica]|uniref:Uncharacterized protein n=1 Tax=Canna indica TaxID=4628 RepID=A0AAQ3QA70_9LILI|nr:hypothetical protein Cni_G10760 [Canna indica]
MESSRPVQRKVVEGKRTDCAAKDLSRHVCFDTISANVDDFSLVRVKLQTGAQFKASEKECKSSNGGLIRLAENEEVIGEEDMRDILICKRPVNVVFGDGRWEMGDGRWEELMIPTRFDKALGLGTIALIAINLVNSNMGEGPKGMIHGFSSPAMEDDDELCDSSSLYGDSDAELEDDETSSSSQSSSSHLGSNGSFDLSLLMAELPIKRGLSKYFEGKSQSFRSLSDVRCVEDLAKEENPIKKRKKTCGGFEGHGATQRQDCNTPITHGRTISKKASRGSSCASNSLTRRNRSCLLLSSKLQALPLPKNQR